MAIVFGSATGHTTSDTEELVVNLPAGVAENDIVLVAVAWSRYDGAPGVTTAGYEEIAELYATSTNTINLSLSWKRMGATPDTSVTCTASNTTFSDVLCIAYVIRGVDASVALDVTPTTATGAGSHDPNPPSIEPVTSGSLIVICGACSNYAASGGDTSVSVPSGYNDQVLLPSVNVTNDATLMMAAKTWAGGVEDPPAWDVDVGIDGADAWAAITVALRQGEDVPTAQFSVTLPVLSSEKYSGGGLQATLPAVIAQFIAEYRNIMDIIFPAIAVQLQADGAYGALVVDAPELRFYGETSAPAWMEVTLPPVLAHSEGGGVLVNELTSLAAVFSGEVGVIGTLDLALSDMQFSAASGANLASTLFPLDALFEGTTGTAGRIVAPLPVLASLFSGDVQTLGTLTVQLAPLSCSIHSSQQTLGALTVGLPPLFGRFEGSAGLVSSLRCTLPEMLSVLTAYTNLTGQLLVEFPEYAAILEAQQTGRFDAITAAQLDSVILKWRRPQ